MPGGYRRVGDRYVLRNHGLDTEVTRAEWERAGAHETRFMTSILLVFSGVAALVLTAPARSSEAAPTTPR